MIHNKKLMALASAAVLMGAVSTANAASYSVTGGGSTLTLAPAFGGLFPTGTVAATTVVTGTGEVDDAGGVFNSATFTTVVSIVSPLNAALSQIITTDYMITDVAGNGTTTVTGCFDAEATEFCDAYTLGASSAIDLANFGFDFSDLNNLNWGTSSITSSAALGVDLQTDINYTAAPSAVPVPAAAWLFGSALLGLTGVARRRKAS
ncbi:MAG: VPLPA-CTERM sorting domain-containing protein [Halioglobus sp.]